MPFREREKTPITREEKDEEEGKEALWREKEKEVEQVPGYRIDEKIKNSVVAFNMMELSTSSSCEGHIDWGISTPWIEVAALNRPEEQFIGEKEIFEKVAKKYKVSVEEVVRDINHNAWIEANRKLEKETPEYLQWRKENKKLMKKTKRLLKEFYKDRKVPSNIRLIIQEKRAEGTFRVHNGGDDYRKVPENLSDKEKGELAQRLALYQEEMKNFTNFLREKYFETNDKK